MAGNLPYVRNSYTNEKDFNNINTAGFYPFGVSKEGYSNIPNVASLEGILVVIKSLSTANYFQMFLGIQDGSLHFRSCYNNSWKGWLKVSA